MKRHAFLFSLLFCLFLFALHGQTSDTLSGEQKSWLSKASRHEKNGWIYVHIEGTPRERGFQHGYLLAKEIKEALRVIRRVWEYRTATDWQWLVARCSKMVAPAIDSENLEEINGIVEGMKAANAPTTRDEMVAYNDWIELIGYWWPTVKNSISPNTPEAKKQSCSSFIATGRMTADGKIVLGHNFWGSYCIPEFKVLLDTLPIKGHRIFMQTAAGLIHSGTDFFVTDAGLVGSETSLMDFSLFDENGIPEFVRMRRATQDASSIDDWCEIMKRGNNGGYANAWLLGDIKTNEIARFELGLKYVGFEKRKDGYFSGSNIAEDPKILRRETKSNEVNIKFSNVARRVRWKQLIEEHAGKIDVQLGQAFLSDHFDTYLGTDSPDSRTICGHSELDNQAMGSDDPFDPIGALDGKVVDASMARNMSFAARWGSSCGMPFDAGKFLEQHPQYDWMRGLLKDRPTQPWVLFKAGER